MKIPQGKEEYHDIYPEFNSEHERMIKHKERSGASAALMAAVAALTALAALLNLNVFGRTMITPTLRSAAPTFAEVEVFSELDDSELSYPILYELIPYGSDKTPVTLDGKLLLTEQDLSDPALSPILTGEIADPDTTLLFENLHSLDAYLLLFRALNGKNAGELFEDALLIRLPQEQLKTPSVPDITQEPAPVTPPPVTPPPVTPSPVTPEPVTPEPTVPGPTDDTRLFYEGEVILEERKKAPAKPKDTPSQGPYITVGP